MKSSLDFRTGIETIDIGTYFARYGRLASFREGEAAALPQALQSDFGLVDSHFASIILGGGASLSTTSQSSPLVTQADIDELETGITLALGQVEQLLVAEGFAANLPVLGTNLKQAYDQVNEALRTIGTLKTAIVGALNDVSNLSNLESLDKTTIQATIKQYVDDAIAALNPGGSGSGASLNSVSGGYGGFVTVNVSDSGAIALIFDTGRTTSFSFNAGNLGMNAVGFTMGGTATAALTYDFNFTAGLNSSGVYLDGSNTHLTLGADISLGTLGATGNLGFMSYNVTNIQDGLENSLGQTVTTGGADTLSLNLSAGFTPGLIYNFSTNLLDVRASGNVDLDVHLAAAMGGAAAPAIDGDLHVDYTFASVLLNGTNTVDWGDVVVKLDHVQYDLGDFIENFVAPVFQKIAAVLDPLNQALDVLRYDLGTVLPHEWEQLLDIAGASDGGPDGKVTALDLLASTGVDVDGLVAFLNVIEDIVKVANFLTADLFNPGIKFDVGGYEVVIDDLSDATQALNQLDFASGTFQSVGADILQFLSGINDTLNGDTTLWTDVVNGREVTSLVEDLLDSSIFQIPILDNPQDAIKFMLGQTVDLVKFDMAPINIGVGFDSAGNLTNPVPIFGMPIWALPPITMNVGVALQAVIDLAFGYDTSGFALWANSTNYDPNQLSLLLDGLYFDDQIVDGVDKPEVTIRAGVEIGGTLDVGIGSLWGGGNIIGEVGFDLRDSLVDVNGKLYYADITDPFSMFEIDGGRITAGFRAGLDLGIGPFRGTVWSYQSPRLTLLDIDNSANPNIGPPPGLGDMVASELHLNIGARAGERDIPNKLDAAELIDIGVAGPDGVRLGGFGFTERFPGLGNPNITRIVGDGGAGNDQLLADRGLGIALWLAGRGGDDELSGGSLADLLEGGEGDDWIAGNGGGDTISGGNGFDFASYLYSTTAISLDLSLASPGVSGDAVGDSFSSIEAFEGSPFNDTMRGGSGSDRFYAGDGNDIVNGRGGNDFLVAGFGANTVSGGNGYDILSYYFASGAVTVVQSSSGGTVQLANAGSQGGFLINDTVTDVEEIQGSRFGDTMTGGAGNQVFNGLDGDDQLDGGAGDDTLIGGRGADVLNGGSGYDVASYVGASGEVWVNLATGGVIGEAQGDSYLGIEEVHGTRFSDTLEGDNSGNVLRGMDGDDKLNGAGGDDTLDGGLGGDTINGGAGRDEASYRNAAAGVLVNLATGVHGGEAAGDTFASIEVIAGSEYGDTIRGSDTITTTEQSREELLGNGGADFLYGGGGGDTLRGGDDNDRLEGETGDDALYGDKGNDTLFGGAGSDELVGGEGNDTLDGGGDRDRVSYIASLAGVEVNLSKTVQTKGGSSISALTARDGLGGTDSFLLDGATNLSSIEDAIGSAFADVIIASEGGSSIQGLAGNDKLYGLAGADNLAGGAGSDTLDGGAGIDTADYSADVGAVLADLHSGTASDGFGGTDTLIAIENLIGSAQGDTLFGNSGVNRIEGGGGDDQIDGRGGADVMVGGAGDDIYFVDRVTGSGANDQVIEASGGGSDIIKTSVNYGSASFIVPLAAEVEDLQLLGSVVFGYGNGLSNRMIGNDAANVMDGLGGSDTFWGYAGNDIYYFDSLGDSIGVGDAPRSGNVGNGEVANGGIDEIRLATAGLTPANIAIIYSLDTGWGQYVENLVLLDDDRTIHLTGNALDNLLVGNGSWQTLRGGDGNDVLDPGRGRDTVHGEAGTDTLVIDWSDIDYGQTTSLSGNLADGYSGLYFFGPNPGHGAYDRVDFSGVEKFDITMGSGGDYIVTGDGNDRIIGNGGDDHLVSRKGVDVIDGGSGNDRWEADKSEATAGQAIIVNLRLTGIQSTYLGTGTVRGIDMLTLTTGAGNDVITTLDARFDDQLVTNDGNDRVILAGGRDNVQLGAGIDTLVIDWSDIDYGQTTSLSGNLADGYSGLYFFGPNPGHGAYDRVDFSGVEKFDITMGSGGDNVVTGDGDDIVKGGAGNDWLRSRGGVDVIDGGSEVDGSRGVDVWTADKSAATAGMTIDLTVNTASTYQIGTLTGSVVEIEALGLNPDERFISGSGKDVIRTMDARYDDYIDVGGGDDRVILAGGRDNVQLGAGTDTLVIDWSDIDYGQTTSLSGNLADGYSGLYFFGPNPGHGAYDRVDFSGVEKFDITMGSGGDYIVTGDGNDRIIGNGGDDHLVSRKGVDVIDGGSGNDRWEADKSEATAGQAIIVNLRLTGIQSTYLGTGTVRGIDMLTLTTGACNDVITTLDARFDDQLVTNDGNDRVILAGGRDNVQLGAGIDTLVIDWSDIDYGQTTSLSGNLADGYSGLYFFGPNPGHGAYDRVDFSGVEKFDITMGSGGDYIVTGDGNDRIIGNGGDDHLVSRKGVDVIDGGSGNDRWEADKSEATAGQAIIVNLRLTGIQSTYLGTGTVRGIDMLTLTTGAGNDVITTLDARFDDQLVTNDGNDRVILAGGRDNVQLGAGIDTLVIDWSDIDYGQTTSLSGNLADGYSGLYFFGPNPGHGAYDRVDFSGVEKFDITMGSGGDYIVTGDGNDRIDGGLGLDTIDAGGGSDTIVYGSRNASISVTLNRSTAVTVFVGGAAEDTIVNVENVIGGSGDDMLTGDALANLLDGGAGDDTINGGHGDDQLLGGTGIDTVSYTNAGAAVRISLAFQNRAQDTLGDGRDTLSGFENLRGSNFSDILVGDAANNRIDGGDGKDRINAGSGDDLIFGDAGDDVIEGAGGNDTMHGGLGNDSYTIRDAGDVIIENANEGIDSVKSQINYTLGANVETLALVGGARIGTGNALNNTISGRGGADTLSGLAGNDIIRGNNAADTINGGTGDDLIDGGQGKDIMTGGEGKDRFQFRFASDFNATRNSADVITDFNQAEGDDIQLNAIDANTNTGANDAFEWISTNVFSNTAGEMRYQQIAGDTFIEGDTDGDGQADLMIRLTGLYTLDATDFIGVSDLQPNAAPASLSPLLGYTEMFADEEAAGFAIAPTTAFEGAGSPHGLNPAALFDAPLPEPITLYVDNVI